MKCVLDTNICIYLIKRKPTQVLEKFRSHSLGDIGISSITVAEMQYGVQKSQFPAPNQIALEQFLAPLVVADFDSQAAAHYGQIRAYLEKAGTPIGAYDLLIAAHARSLGITLVTINIREFSRVPELNIENWAD